MIRDYIPDSDLDFLPISDPGSKRHRIPDPQHWLAYCNIIFCEYQRWPSLAKAGDFDFFSYLASTTRHKFLNSLFYFRRKSVLRGFTRMKTQNRDLWLLQCLRSGVVRRQNRARMGQSGAFTLARAKGAIQNPHEILGPDIRII
jgi:hypothetical protein